MNKKICAEYIWIDGQRPTAKLRSKTKILDLEQMKFESWSDNGFTQIIPSEEDNEVDPLSIPYWSFDGSSTEQAEGRFSDCILVPVQALPDPIRGGQNILVLNEVMNTDGSPHISNTRAILRKAVAQYTNEEPLFGIEQEYTLYGKNDWPHGWPKPWPKFLRWLNKLGLKKGCPPPQGRFYCGVGFDEVHGRPLIEDHLKKCLDAGFAGINAEVMPAQWEFQVGPSGPLEVADQLWLARWLLYRIGEDYNAYAKLDPKPMSGNWNGAGAHTNFSTKTMRREGGIKAILKACEKLGTRHKQHIAVYGDGNQKRLTGKHETCGIETFRYGVGDRGASIRIPTPVHNAGKGYLEDRRPAANIDPYKVCTALLETICGNGFDPSAYGWRPDCII